MTPRAMPPVTRVPVHHLGPEDAVITADGTVYSALRNDGKLLRVRPGETEAEVIADIGGRGLGCELMDDGRILVCNADLGLQAVDPESGTVEALLETVHGAPFGVCNNAAIAPDGTIYFSESSQVFHLENFRKDIIEDTQTGRLLRWRPGEEPEILLSGLSFANGVVLDPDGRFVLVAETGKMKIHRVWLDSGKADLFAEVPGFPDNLSIGSDGLLWCAVPSLPLDSLQKIHGLPKFVRKLIAQLPEALGPQVPKCCRVAAFDLSGNLVHLLEGDPSVYHYVTGVRERDGKIWIGSINEDALGYFTMPPPSEADG
ncbi:MAG: SMP-30/gluconolactonase/LRE family protein [Pseudomonadota bacterium]